MNQNPEMPFIVLPSFVRDFKNVPEQYSHCVICKKRIVNEKKEVEGAVWYMDGFHCESCKDKTQFKI